MAALCAALASWVHSRENRARIEALERPAGGPVSKAGSVGLPERE